MKPTYEPSDLPASYQEALKNRYLGQLRMMYGYINSGHMPHAHECQLRAEETLQMLLSLGERHLHTQFTDLGRQLGLIVFSAARQREFRRIDGEFLKAIKKPLNRKKKK